MVQFHTRKNRTQLMNDELYEVMMLANKNGLVVTTDNRFPVDAIITGSTPAGSNKPFYLEVQQGLITGYQFNHKFGAAPSMAAGTATVWDVNDTLYPWDALGSGSVVNIERNNVADNGFVVTVQGLDDNYEFAEEVITITGADQVGSQLFTRVNRAFISDTGTTNASDIDIEAGAAGGTTVGRITAGYGQTLMAVYTIPAGKTGYLVHLACTGSTPAPSHTHTRPADVLLASGTHGINPRE